MANFRCVTKACLIGWLLLCCAAVYGLESPTRDHIGLPETERQGAVTFVNLGQQIELRSLGSAYELQTQGKKLQVQLADRLVIKTKREVGADRLSQLDPRILRVQQLARLEQADLWLITFSGNDIQGVMERLRQHKAVIYAHPDILQSRKAAQVQGESSGPMSIGLVAQPEVKGVRLAIIDDGFNFNHPEFSGAKVVFQYDADRRTNDVSPQSSLDQHGTLVAGLIAAEADQQGIDGLAPNAELIAIRQVSSWTSDMILAFSVARLMKADVVNGSWILPFLPEPLFDLLTDWINEEKPYLIFAAGNNQSDACEANALSQLKHVWLIGAENAHGERMPYSNYGSCVSLYAPARFSSTAASGQGYKAFAGTSAATAYVSGFLARELAVGNRPNLASVSAMLKGPQTTKSDMNDSGK